MSIRVLEETPNLPVALHGRGQERSAPRRQDLISRTAVWNSDRQLVAHQFARRRRRKCNRWLVGGWSSAGDQQEPGPSELQDGRGAAVLTKLLCAQHISVEVARLLEVTHYTQHGHLDSVGGKVLLHGRSLPLANRSTRPPALAGLRSSFFPAAACTRGVPGSRRLGAQHPEHIVSVLPQLRLSHSRHVQQLSQIGRSR